MIRLVMASAVFACGAAFANPPELNVSPSVESCGAGYEELRQFFRGVALADKAALVLGDDAIYAYEAFVPRKRALSKPQKAELRRSFETAFRARASEPGGFVDVAACWHSTHVRRDFDWEAYRNVILQLKKETSTLGTQNLDWLAREWCPKVWKPVLAEVQRGSTFPIPAFRGLIWCGSRDNQ